jgi:hypothetical protein
MSVGGVKIDLLRLGVVSLRIKQRGFAIVGHGGTGGSEVLRCDPDFPQQVGGDLLRCGEIPQTNRRRGTGALVPGLRG